MALAFLYNAAHLHHARWRPCTIHIRVSIVSRKRRAPQHGQACTSHIRQQSSSREPAGGTLVEGAAVIAAIIAGLAAVIVALIGLGTPKSKPSEPTKIEQQTHGPNSPAVGGVGGNVTIHQPPGDKQP